MSAAQTPYISGSPEATQRWAAQLAARLAPGTVLALYGGLGAGKTCLVQGLARGLGVTSPVASPTFTLVREHPGRIPLYHIDLFRIVNPQEALALGIEDYLYGSGIAALEWAERVEPLLPPQTLRIRLEEGAHPTERIITLQAGQTP